MFFKRHFQNAYVTHNLDKALALLEDRYGLTNPIVFEPEMELITPAGTKNASVRAALLWDGHFQIELIEPVSGFVGHYRDYLPDDKTDFVPRFNHIAVRRDDLDEMRDEIEKTNLPLVVEGSVPGLVFVYLDARDSLGHYFEYIWATPEGWAMQGWPD